MKDPIYVVIYGKSDHPGFCSCSRINYDNVELYSNLDDIKKKFELGDFGDDDPIVLDGSLRYTNRLNNYWYHIKIYKKNTMATVSWDPPEEVL